MCGITILREQYRLTFNEDYASSDDSIFDILEGFPALPPVRNLDYRSRCGLVGIMRAFIKGN